MAHMWGSGSRLACRPNRLSPVDALERHPRILFTAELNRRRPVTAGRIEDPRRVGAQLLFLLQPIVGVGPVDAAGEDSALAGLDRLTRLLVLYHDPVGDRLQGQRWRRVGGHPERVVVRP